MLNFIRKYWKHALLALVLALICWFVAASQGFKDCMCHYKNGNAYQAAQESIALIYIVFRGSVGCLGKFLDAHAGAIAALATIFIGWYTFTLYRATNGLFILAEQQGIDMRASLDSVRAQERALIYGGPGMNWIEKEDGPLIGKIITIGNYGRSPGYLEKVVWGIHVFEGWDRKRKMSNVIVMRDILYPNSPPVGRCPIKLPFEQGKTLAFYGRIYFKDIYGHYWYTTWEHRLEAKEDWASYPLEHNAELRRVKKGKTQRKQ